MLARTTRLVAFVYCHGVELYYFIQLNLTSCFCLVIQTIVAFCVPQYCYHLLICSEISGRRELLLKLFSAFPLSI